jgi:hypothetical protein
LDVKWQGGVYAPNNLLNPTLPRPKAGIAQGQCFFFDLSNIATPQAGIHPSTK